jgi:coproporphyrinogen III oxidase-like Fe-S oxidoreductase
MLIEKFITAYARKKNENYLQFIPSEKLTIPSAKRDVPTMLYMHIPFCEELCPYCSFNRVKFREGLAREYFGALRREIVMYKEMGYDFNALYVGGGTPTVLIDELELTVTLIRNTFKIKEISVETNPNHLTARNITILKSIGVNRLSVGVQTFDDSLLKVIERYHKYGSGQEIVERLHHTMGNFQTLNVDMIFNFPTQGMDVLENDLSTLVGLKVDQVTYYPLMVSSYTHDMMNKKLGRVDYDRGKAFYDRITEMLSPQYKASTAWCFSRKDRVVLSEPFKPFKPFREEGATPLRGQAQALFTDNLTGEAHSTHSVREGEARTALPGEGATPLRGQAQALFTDNLTGEAHSTHSVREGEARTALPGEGATQVTFTDIQTGEVHSTHSVREGEARTALPGEGATQAPIIDEYVVNYDEYAGVGSGSIGYLDGSAYANTFDIGEYIKRINDGLLPVTAKKSFSLKERLSYDFLMKLFGMSIDIGQLSAKHHVNAYWHLLPEISFFILTGGLEKQGNTLTLTKKGQYYWVLMMREFFIGVNNFRDYCREQLEKGQRTGN